jgi:hypothetical protein
MPCARIRSDATSDNEKPIVAFLDGETEDLRVFCSKRFPL